MPNHPSRNWRRVATEAAGLHATRWRMANPVTGDSPLSLLTYAEANKLHADIEAAYVAGYEAGRRSMQRTTP